MHSLSEKWIVWSHLPQDINWSIDSYTPIMTITTVEELITLMQTLPDKIISSCMLFLMKEHVKPIWEDVRNKDGGCFSYKINDKIADVWKNVSYSIAGQTASKDVMLNRHISGISISPKKNFCILKIWMDSCEYKDPSKIVILNPSGCIFKKH